METITQKEIGKRISKIRKRKGYSQEDLAKVLNISRPSITQIELGNRNLSALELKRIADNLAVSVDGLLSEGFGEENLVLQEEAVTKESKIRTSVPDLKVNKAINMLLYVLEKCAGKPNVGESLLYKLLYFSDFNYYEIYEEHLTGLTYRKLSYGPVPVKLDSIIEHMISKEMLKRIKTNYRGNAQTRYIPLAKPNLTLIKASEVDVIDKVIDQFSDWSPVALNSYLQKDMPWLASKDGEIIDYELAFYREHPYSVRTYEKNAEVV